MNLVSVQIKVEEAEFVGALPGAFEEWVVQAFEYLDHTADQVVDKAVSLVAKRTGRLASTIRRGPLVRTPKGAWIEIQAGDGTRYAIFQEFGSYKMKAHPFLRPAMAMAAGLARGVGYAARVSSTSKTRAAARRETHRAKLRRAVHAGLLTSTEARRESRRISTIKHFRG